MELDPLSIYKARTLSLVLGIDGQVSEAKALLTKLEPLYSQNPHLYLGFADCYMFERDFGTAQKMLDQGLSISSEEPLLLIDQALLYAFTERRLDAEEVLRKLQVHKSQSVRTYSKIFIQAALGNLDEAFEALTRGADTHSWPFLIQTLPVFQELRKDPRFGEFCRKMDIPT